MASVKELRRLQTSPVSWLGDKFAVHGVTREQQLVAFPQRNAAVARKRKNRLTVARRRRRCTVFPSTKSAVEVEGRSPYGVARSEARGFQVRVIQQLAIYRKA